MEAMPCDRARELLRSGADLTASSSGHVDAPTPLDVAARLGAVPHDGSAAGCVLAAALAWSPATHAYFPHFARAWAVELLKVGYLLSRQLGEAHALVELWRDVLLPSVITRDGGMLWPRARSIGSSRSSASVRAP